MTPPATYHHRTRSLTEHTTLLLAPNQDNLSNFVWLSHTRNTIAGHDRTRYKYLGFCLLESRMLLVICIFKVDRHTSALFAGSIKNNFFKYDFAKMRLTLAFSYFI